LADLGDLSKLNTALIFSTLENHLKERNYSDLMFEICHFFDNVGELADGLLVLFDGLFECLDLSKAEGLHHVVEPLEWSSDQRIYYVFIEEFGNVEYVLAEQDRHTHFR